MLKIKRERFKIKKPKKQRQILRNIQRFLTPPILKTIKPPPIHKHSILLKKQIKAKTRTHQTKMPQKRQINRKRTQQIHKNNQSYIPEIDDQGECE